MSEQPSTTHSPLRPVHDPRNAAARDAALQAVRGDEPVDAGCVTYDSGGRVLIIAGGLRAMQLATTLASSGGVSCTIVTGMDASDGAAADRPRRAHAPDPIDVTTVWGTVGELSGHLGAFQVRINETGGRSSATEAPQTFDLVLDMSIPPLIQRETPPPGYYAPQRDETMLARALEELPTLVGAFEKPRFFHYDPDICAHGTSGIGGCTRCLDACPTGAISSLGDTVSVDAYLCQGGGSCAAACPSGAMRYDYPSAGALLDKVRALLKAYRAAGGRHASIVFHDRDVGQRTLERAASDLPGHFIPVAIEEVGALGMDVWLAVLSYGAAQVVVLVPSGLPQAVRRELRAQMTYTTAILAGMGYSGERLRAVVADDTTLAQVLSGLRVEDALRPAGFAGIDEKRTTIRLAVDALYTQAPSPRATAPLPDGAPFGEINVDGAACTLCMACVSVCPAAALADGADRPQLRFIEWNCVQCGICEAACPEHAITRTARFIYADEQRRVERVLHEEQPFLCIRCGRPFATCSVVEAMTARLKEHWMFQSPAALQRLRMCEDCRVKDMYSREGGLIAPHRGVDDPVDE